MPTTNFVTPILSARADASAIMANGAASLVQICPEIADIVPTLVGICGPTWNWEPDRKPLTYPVFVAELCFNLVNYCYWGDDGVSRPGGGATVARKAVFAEFGLTQWPTLDECVASADREDGMSARIETLAALFQGSDYPMAKERAEMLRAVIPVLPTLKPIWEICAWDAATETEVAAVLTAVPAFGGDPFFKRLFLFFMLLYRIYGRCEPLARTIPLPSDYQVPKVLRAAGVLTYSETLAREVDSGNLISAGSPMEMAIRASAIIAVERIATATRCSEEATDGWLWACRDKVLAKHHLTRTANY